MKKKSLVCFLKPDWYFGEYFKGSKMIYFPQTYPDRKYFHLLEGYYKLIGKTWKFKPYNPVKVRITIEEIK